MAEVLTVREYVSITNNSIGEFLATEVLKKREEMLTEHRAHIEKNKKVVTRGSAGRGVKVFFLTPWRPRPTPSGNCCAAFP
jgi:hypothetical protein